MTDSRPSNATGSRFSFVGEESPNNLLSDLAPLLTLFRETVTKQFLSMSFGWADNILIAVGPLGMVTIIVSAIRVGGERRLKALVGRTRESKATTEAELLTSTSDDVCELWNGQEVVRQPGRPDTTELVLVAIPPNARAPENDWNFEITTLSSAVRDGDFVPAILPRMKTTASTRQRAIEFPWLAEGAPNLTLNMPGAITRKDELWGWAILGLIGQAIDHETGDCYCAGFSSQCRLHMQLEEGAVAQAGAGLGIKVCFEDERSSTERFIGTFGYLKRRP